MAASAVESSSQSHETRGQGDAEEKHPQPAAATAAGGAGGGVEIRAAKRFKLSARFADSEGTEDERMRMRMSTSHGSSASTMISADNTIPSSDASIPTAPSEHLKCVYIFRHDRDDCQLIKSSGEILNLIAPYVGPTDESIDFEINLKIRGNMGESNDRIFSNGFTEAPETSNSGQTKRVLLSSWLSTLELAYTTAHFTVQVAIGINILKGSSNFLGIIKACGTKNEGDAVLYDSEVSGTRIALGDDGSIALSRNVVVLHVDEMLLLKFFVYDDDMISKSAPIILTLGHNDESFNIEQGSYKLRVKLDWTKINLLGNIN
ncbi:hypothetical protein OsI_13194 [Oryza sativa Indica Group]|uniref:DUF6598 domain-containing protein n=1 Tax=Oryza sativa subsp. indica TaxID=39946 RepID=B8AQA6_ORYSI|nr:hypothetical protein OsI_13194 [Oryza sativa Indica Group]